MGILDAPGYSRAGAEQRFQSRRYQWVPIATKANPPANPSVALTDGVWLGGTAKLAHLATRTCHGIRFVYANWGALTNNTETDGPNDITIKAALEFPANQMIQVRWNGALSVVVPAGGTVVSDPIGIDLAKGTTFYSRTFVSVTSGQKWMLGNIPTASTGEGNNYGSPAGADLTIPGSASLTGIGTNAYVYAPAAILGRVQDEGKAVVGLLGDSIMAGNGDTGGSTGGYTQRALNNNYSFQKVAFPGENLTGFNGLNGTTRMRRMALLEHCNLTHILTNYTVNQLAQTTIQQDAVTAWITMNRIAPYVWAATLTPQTTSTDAWATVGNQTVANAANETRRLAFNNWMRDGAPIQNNAPVAVGTSGAGVYRAGQSGHPLTGWYEIADLAESARDSGKWKAAYTADGTHPNATAHAALAAGVPVTTALGAIST